MTRIALFCSSLMVLLGLTVQAQANQRQVIPSVDNRQVQRWNAFAEALQQIHLQRLDTRSIRTTRDQGRYGGSLWGDVSYTETRFFDADSGRLLSRIRRDSLDPDRIHVIEVFIYARDGKLVRDYLAAYLPGHRNAPVQTLINLHNRTPELSGYRQFDASGRLIYEQCRGEFFGDRISLSYEEWEVPAGPDELEGMLEQEAYRSCFAGLDRHPGPYLDPRVEIGGAAAQRSDSAAGEPTHEQLRSRIRALSRRLAAESENPRLYLQRGDAYGLLRLHQEAIADYSAAIALDAGLDQAYFGRGMAHGRAGQLEAAITDLSVYLERNPEDSVAYTKRGVRHIWAGDFEAAERDLRQALALDGDNAEAHDDLGVVLAQNKAYQEAAEHFRAAIRIDPGYQKAYHNLAIVQYFTGRLEVALKTIDQALQLQQDNRSSLRLKAAILDSLGRDKEARQLNEIAEFLPAGSWTERSEIR